MSLDSKSLGQSSSVTHLKPYKPKKTEHGNLSLIGWERSLFNGAIQLVFFACSSGNRFFRHSNLRTTVSLPAMTFWRGAWPTKGFGSLSCHTKPLCNPNLFFLCGRHYRIHMLEFQTINDETFFHRGQWALPIFWVPIWRGVWTPGSAKGFSTFAASLDSLTDVEADLTLSFNTVLATGIDWLCSHELRQQNSWSIFLNDPSKAV